MSDSKEKGRELELRIAAFLRTHDYEVSTNVMREGRSGARHELDVVAVKHDGLTSFLLIVECKAWESPIDKDVVYKLAAELADIGAAKGVIATLSGWTVQAEQAAKQANIEMWGPEELSVRLGQLSMNQLHQGGNQSISAGLRFTTTSEVALGRVNRSTQGIFGVGKEEITSYGPLWLPTWSLQLGITRDGGLLKKTARVTSVWNGYDALASNCVFKSISQIPFVDVNVANNAIVSTLKVSDVVKLLNSKIALWRQTKKPEHKKQHAASLVRSGIQPPLSSLAVESSALIYFPLWVAIVSKRDQDRVIAIDGLSGIESRHLSETLTKNAQRVRSAFDH
jgi:hypothetical protein